MEKVEQDRVEVTHYGCWGLAGKRSGDGGRGRGGGVGGAFDRTWDTCVEKTKKQKKQSTKFSLVFDKETRLLYTANHCGICNKQETRT